MSMISPYNKDDRVMVFIDVRNVMGSVKMDSAFSRLDFGALTMRLKGQRQLVAAYVFDGVGSFVNGVDRTKKFHDFLRYSGFRVVERDSYDSETREQKEVDVAMACKMVVHALNDHYDVAIVVSGDRDFVPAVSEVQAAGKRVEVASFSNSASDELIRAADVYHRLDSEPVLSLYNPKVEEEIVVDACDLVAAEAE
ncbi:MAG: NYN domain-containing protein [Thermoplasmata archaeon]|nr:NYN domain-containing protein [Thermoplasmata archaeon]